MYFFYKDFKIYYKIYGQLKNDSPSILFLHGWGGSTKSFEFFADNIKKDFFCISLDFPPFENSSKLCRPINIKEYAEIVENLLYYLKVVNIFIVAHSFGGRVAIEMATNNQKKFKIEKMLLTGSAGIKKISLKTKLLIIKYKILKFLSKLKLYSQKNLKKFGSSDYKNLDENTKKTFCNIINYNQKKLLCKIKCPVLLIWGEYDKETPFYFTKIFKKNIKECEVIKFEGCSHFAYLEKPILFQKILLIFFTENYKK